MNDRGELSHDLFNRISAKLREITVGSHFIAIEMAAGTGVEGCQSMHILAASGDHLLFRQHPVRRSEGVHFPNDLDNFVVLATIQRAFRHFSARAGE